VNGRHEEGYGTVCAICTCIQIWTILSLLTKTKPNTNPNHITFLKFLELTGKVYKMKEVESSKQANWFYWHQNKIQCGNPPV